MEINKGSGDVYVIGPLATYKCDAVSIRKHARDDGVYHLRAIEADGEFDYQNIDSYYDADILSTDEGKGKYVGIYLNEEEMEALFLAWQVLKKGE
jgi:hypothetical protein